MNPLSIIGKTLMERFYKEENSSLDFPGRGEEGKAVGKHVPSNQTTRFPFPPHRVLKGKNSFGMEQ
jgi:hypothetical protein